MENRTRGYAVVDSTTGRKLGVWHSVSERGAKSQAAKATGIEYRYLSAILFVPVVELETMEQADNGYSWVEVEYGDESDHWTKKLSTDGDLPKALELAREYIAKGFGNRVSVVKLVYIAPETIVLSGDYYLTNADGTPNPIGSTTVTLSTPETAPADSPDSQWEALQGKRYDALDESDAIADNLITGWRYEVSNGDTVLGYVEWLDHKLETGN